MPVIRREGCTECGVGEPTWPEEAIVPATEPDSEKWVALNQKYAEIWPNITEHKDPPADAEKWSGKPDKLEYISPAPAAA